ncbi:hypothetical protein IHE55_29345 [Streptomyces pactum]|uniref:Beta-ketoacyl synthase-like N-terminal domain-containing protein n=1 Tax=Streptomyces pactum TaxID=68249 RepID=A0ABS0NTY4_9ACTN|nr:beta-ketoacyl synthase N-terminal-like domain-containing protein [Streptomyces pactum]MBH5338668.1 hypothetical protein [Streptomyces pactum]
MTNSEENRATAYGRPADLVAVIGSSGGFPGAPHPASPAPGTPRGDEDQRAGGEDPAADGTGHRTPGDRAPRTPGDGDRYTEDRFEAAFFGLSDAEAAAATPGARLATELGWTALEHAGLIPRQITPERTVLHIGAAEPGATDLLGRVLGTPAPAGITGPSMTDAVTRAVRDLLDHRADLASRRRRPPRPRHHRLLRDRPRHRAGRSRPPPRRRPARTARSATPAAPAARCWSSNASPTRCATATASPACCGPPAPAPPPGRPRPPAPPPR